MTRKIVEQKYFLIADSVDSDSVIAIEAQPTDKGINYELNVGFGSNLFHFSREGEEGLAALEKIADVLQQVITRYREK